MLRIEITSNIFNALYPSYFLNEFETYILIHKVNFVLIWLRNFDSMYNYWNNKQQSNDHNILFFCKINDTSLQCRIYFCF